VPIIKRKLDEADATLQELRKGLIMGRAVLVPWARPAARRFVCRTGPTAARQHNVVRRWWRRLREEHFTRAGCM